jgi:hypothetical protein
LIWHRLVVYNEMKLPKHLLRCLADFRCSIMTDLSNSSSASFIGGATFSCSLWEEKVLAVAGQNEKNDWPCNNAMAIAKRFYLVHLNMYTLAKTDCFVGYVKVSVDINEC